MAVIDDCSPLAEPEPVPGQEPVAMPAHADPSSVSMPAHPDPTSISPDAWSRFESATVAVVGKIQPTVSSERLRAAIIDYVQRLFRFRVGCEVFPFGSVPLKTYLPDGDIDLTAFGPVSSDENLANEVRAILQSEERRKDAEFEVKDVQCINAEVKLVKCLVQNIVVDISFNQIGGLCTLCFLEKVDQLFGKDHLFKRSIVLIKDWCYYESRILGAHHGLISTYALETLVLYILHIFHKSLDGPLAVLYRFLDYYSKFDWDNKGISLFGPVSLSSLPELVTDSPDTHDDDFHQREVFLKEFSKTFGVPPRNSEDSARVFSRKFLNIVDPLKKSNNLGRSVSKGNFYRIRSAFDLGARKLGKTLQVPASSIVNETNQFFRNTLKRNRSGVRPDVLVDALATSNSVFASENSQRGGAANDTVSDLTGDLNTHWNNLMYVQQYQLDNPTSQVYYQMPSTPPAQYQNTRSSNGHGRKNAFGYAGTNGVVPGPSFSPSYVWFRPYFQTDDPTAMRARGTGTYFPDPNLCRDRPSTGRGERGRNHFPPNNHQRFHHYIRTDMPADIIPLDELGQELPLQIYVPGAYDRGITSPLNVPVPSPPTQSPREPFKDSKPEFGSLGTLSVEGTSKGHASRSDSSSNSQASGPLSPVSATKSPQTGWNRMRNGQPYHLKDNGDFPPLSSC
ncbi:hypothetical protein ACP4OV_003352 [Aristida adscensionis]